jgi:hypothetical protein
LRKASTFSSSLPFFEFYCKRQYFLKMARSRSTSRSRAATKKSPSKSPKRAARKSEPVSAKKTAAAARPTPKKSASPARKKATPSPSGTKSPSKASSSSATTIRSRTRSRSNTRPTPSTTSGTTKRSVSPNKIERTISPTIRSREESSPIHTPEIRHHRKSPSPIFSSTRPRRAAYTAANREFGGTESARYLNVRRAEPTKTKSILPTVTWPTWSRKLKNHWNRHHTLYTILGSLLLMLIASYFFGKQIQKQLHLIHHSLGEIYEEQKRRFDSMIWESPTEKAARENALPPPPPPHQEPAPSRPPNPHIPKIPKAQNL